MLTAAGLTWRHAYFPRPPSVGAYAVYTEEITTDGPDGEPRILTHDVTVLVYAANSDEADAADAALAAELRRLGLQWTRSDRTWQQDEKRTETFYDFTYYTKEA